MPSVRLKQKSAEKYVAAGEEAEVRDVSTPGLVLRVRKSGNWMWTYRRTIKGRDYRRDLGNEWTLEEAGEIVRDVNHLVDHGNAHVVMLPDAFSNWLAPSVGRKHGKRFVDEPPPPPPPKPEPDGVLWRDAQSSWVAYVKRTLKPKTATSYKGALDIAEIAKLHGRRVSTVTPQEVAIVVAKIAERGAERQAQTTVCAVRGMWEWMGDLERQEKYGIAPGAMEALKAPKRTRAGKTRPVAIPNGAEIGGIVRWLRDMPDKGPQRRDRLAALLLVYSAQRREYVASAQREDFRLVDGTPVWTIPPAHRKTAEMSERRGVPAGSHVIPLQPRHGRSSRVRWRKRETASDFSQGSARAERVRR